MSAPKDVELDTAAAPPEKRQAPPAAPLRRGSTMTWVHKTLSASSTGLPRAGSTQESMDRAADDLALPAEGATLDENDDDDDDENAPVVDGPIIDAEDKSELRVTRESLRNRKRGGGGKGALPSAVFARADADAEEQHTFADRDVVGTLAAKGAAEKDAVASSDAGCMTRAAVRLSLHGQMVVFMTLHTLATLGVFFFFFTRKWLQREAAVPAGANRYWMKRVIPSLESGAMHTALLTFGLIPLTMCRWTASKLRSTWVSRFLPLDYLVELHKYFAYVIGVQLVSTIVVFFTFFGTLCQDWKDGREPSPIGCDNLQSEIMITGYIIAGIYLIMWVTSLFCIRGRRYFEVFYYTHHLFVAIYGVLLGHTFDREQRDGVQNRSQTWPWLVFPLGYYFIDRFLMASGSRKTSMTAARLFFYPKAMVVELKRPEGFTFRAGQFVQMNVPSVSRLQWHPFSVLSAPEDPTLRLCIRAEHGGWTEDLFRALQSRQTAVHRVGSTLSHHSSYNRDVADVTPEALADLGVWIMGPFGAPSQDVRLYEYGVLLGSGTGVVPMLSQLRSIISSYSRLHRSQSRAGLGSAAAASPKGGAGEPASRSGDDSGDEEAQEPPPPAATDTATPSGARSPVSSPRESMDGGPAGGATWAERGLRRLEGTRYALYNLLLLAADFSLFLVMLILVRHNQYTESRHRVLQGVTGATTFLYCAECPFRVMSLVHSQGLRSKRSVRALVDALFCMPMVVVYLVYLVEFNVHPSYSGDGAAFITLSSFFYLYRVVWRWYTNPFAVRGESHVWLPPGQDLETAGQLKAFGIGRTRRVKFLWICRTLNMFRWLQDELADLQDEAHRVCPGVIDIQVHVTSEKLSQDLLDEVTAGTGLEGRVAHARPILAATFAHLRDKLHRAQRRKPGPRRVMRVGVFFSGALSLEWEVEQLALNIASTSRVRFHFRSENDTLQWKNRKFERVDASDFDEHLPDRLKSDMDLAKAGPDAGADTRSDDGVGPAIHV